MSTTVGLDEGVQLRRAEDEWLHQTAERLRRASRRPGSRTSDRSGVVSGADQGGRR